MKWLRTQPRHALALFLPSVTLCMTGSDYSTTGIGQQKCKAYVIALEDAGNSCKWSNNVSENLNCSSGSAEDWNGYKFTQIIINAAGGESNALANSYEAIHYAAVDYKNKISAPASSSGWISASYRPALWSLSSTELPAWNYT